MAQYLDPEVSRRKFDREISEFREYQSLYRERGWFLIEERFPVAVILMAVTKSRPPAIALATKFDYSNYDADPPSVTLVDPFSFEPYKMKELPVPLLQRGQPSPDLPSELPAGIQVQVTPQSLMQAYTPDEVPFLCIAGVKEYHSNPGHTGDPWELHRPTGAGRLVRILEVIHDHGIAQIRGLRVTLSPSVVGFDVGFPA